MNETASEQPSGPDFATLFQSVPGLYLALTPELKIIAVSDAYLRATMTEREAILGKGLFEIFPDNPDDPAATGVSNLRTSLLRVLQYKVADTMAVQKYDIRRPASEGGGFEERYWSPINSPVFGPDHDELRYIIHRVEDVTEFIRLKQHGLELDKLTMELRSHAEQAEAELYVRALAVQEANRRLEQANQELARLYERTKELDELKTRFFANVSHELRTPLALILGPTEKLLKQPQFDAETRRQLGVIARNAQTLLRHVNDLLDTAKLESGTMTASYVQLDLAALLRLTASHFESLAAERDIVLRVQAPGTAQAQVDAEKIQRVLLNLLANAFKFVPDGGKVECRLQANDERVQITIDDNGPGVPLALRDIIFERFRQGEEDATRSFGGTGLGLAITKEFLQLHAGTIRVDASPDGGARFEIELPRLAPPGVPVSDGATPSSAQAAQFVAELMPVTPGGALSQIPGKPLVLVIEDNRDMNRYIAETLSGRYRVACAFDGREGLTRALALKPDLIVSDLMMPKMSGDQLVKGLRVHAALSAVPILLLTAKADDALRVELLRDGAQDYLTKPFMPDELVARVDNLLAMDSARQSLRHELAERERQLQALMVRQRELECMLADRERELLQNRPAGTDAPSLERPA